MGMAWWLKSLHWRVPMLLMALWMPKPLVQMWRDFRQGSFGANLEEGSWLMQARGFLLLQV